MNTNTDLLAGVADRSVTPLFVFTRHCAALAVLALLPVLSAGQVQHGMVPANSRAAGSQPVKLFDLTGLWKFEIGDGEILRGSGAQSLRPKLQRAEYVFDDSRWESIQVPSPWEDQGFPGYDGYAWYRKHFRSAQDWQNKPLLIHLGVIDDVDEVFINGHKVGGSGSFPPRYSSAWSYERIYPFPAEYLNPSGDNVVAVRVYDDELNGGILRGPCGIYEDVPPLPIRISLNSGWQFRTGDNGDWKNEILDEYANAGGKWQPIIVPRYWEGQGYEDYDGFAWYRVHFQAPLNCDNERLVLLLGKIDDLDETFINGAEVGHTGSMAYDRRNVQSSGAWQKLRAYTIPSGLLHPGKDNVIAVRVYDGYKDGGIFEGPIGIVTKDDFLGWENHEERNNRRKQGFWEWLDDLINH